MQGQHMLDFGGIDVDAAANDHVGFATGQKQISGIVDPAEVSRKVPPIAKRPQAGLRVVVIPACRAGMPVPNAADLAAFYGVIPVVNDFEGRAENRSADTVRRTGRVVPKQGRASAAVGGAVEIQIARTESVHQLGALFRVENRSGGKKQLQRLENRFFGPSPLRLRASGAEALAPETGGSRGTGSRRTAGPAFRMAEDASGPFRRHTECTSNSRDSPEIERRCAKVAIPFGETDRDEINQKSREELFVRDQRAFGRSGRAR